jgi:hypothetical protein
MYPSPSQPFLQRFFSGLTEQTFETRLGLADPSLVDYIAGLLARFVHCDSVYRVRNLAGKRLDLVTDMLIEADARLGEARREVHRHIGDFTLFWTGVYPEALQRFETGISKDRFLDYSALGKRAYYIASTLGTDDNAGENEVLERLSHDFDLCRYGLSEVRREWERRDDGETPKPIIIN